MKRAIVIISALLSLSLSAGAQSKMFKLGQSVEINTAILQELNRAYVDALPVQRMTKAGIDAMLASLDPYTVYVPEEDNEDFELMIGKTYGGIGAIIYKPKKEEPVLINEPYANSPAALSGLQCGDQILTIDGKTTIGLTASESRYDESTPPEKAIAAFGFCSKNSFNVITLPLYGLNPYNSTSFV